MGLAAAVVVVVFMVVVVVVVFVVVVVVVPVPALKTDSAKFPPHISALLPRQAMEHADAASAAPVDAMVLAQ